MLKYIVKRLILMIPVVIGIVCIVFTIMYLSPGDPARMILGDRATQEQVEVLREEMGLNDPYIVQFGRYVKDAASGDFGRSYTNNIPVMETISQRFPNTVLLAVCGMILSVLIGVPIGILAAIKQDTVIDTFSVIFSMLAASIPTFWMALLLIIVFSLNLGWFPSSGLNGISGLVLPSFALAIAYTPVMIRMTRSSVLEVIRQDYIRTARAKGANSKRILMKHALKNALPPIITVIGLNFGGLLGGAVVTETIFSIPGIGIAMVNAIRYKDMPIVMGGVIVIAIAVSLVNLVVDLICVFINPRLREQ